MWTFVLFAPSWLVRLECTDLTNNADLHHTCRSRLQSVKHDKWGVRRSMRTTTAKHQVELLWYAFIQAVTPWFIIWSDLNKYAWLYPFSPIKQWMFWIKLKLDISLGVNVQRDWKCPRFDELYVVEMLQCSALMDEINKDDYTDDIKEEYEDIRIDHYDSIRVWICSDKS